MNHHKRDIYVALGSNIGDRYSNILKALEQVSKKIDIAKISSFYETQPAYFKEQSNFLNAVLRGGTTLEPLELLTFVKDIEKNMGRKLAQTNGPRIIDLDILFYDDLIIGELSLTIPHPRMVDRSFVLVPMNEIAPNFIHPVLGKPIHALLNCRKDLLGDVARVSKVKISIENKNLL